MFFLSVNCVYAQVTTAEYVAHGNPTSAAAAAAAAAMTDTTVRAYVEGGTEPADAHNTSGASYLFSSRSPVARELGAELWRLGLSQETNLNQV